MDKPLAELYAYSENVNVNSLLIRNNVGFSVAVVLLRHIVVFSISKVGTSGFFERVEDAFLFGE